MKAPGAPATPAASREASAAVGTAAGLDLVLFHWGPWQFAVPASQVTGLGPDTDPEAPTVGDLLELPAGTSHATSDAGPDPPALSRIRRLGLRGSGPGLGLRVQEPLRRVWLEAMAIQPLPPLISARLRLPLVRALALANPGDPAGAIILILDFRGCEKTSFIPGFATPPARDQSSP